MFRVVPTAAFVVTPLWRSCTHHRDRRWEVGLVVVFLAIICSFGALFVIANKKMTLIRQGWCYDWTICS